MLKILSSILLCAATNLTLGHHGATQFDASLECELEVARQFLGESGD